MEPLQESAAELLPGVTLRAGTAGGVQPREGDVRAGVGGAGDAVAVEGGGEGAAVRRAVGEVAVVVVHGAHGAAIASR